MKCMVMDGQGGGLGKILVEQLVRRFPHAEVIGVGTNAIASSAMLRAGASAVATGENAVVYNCKHVDLILGPVGILCANAMYGEISPAMAMAVSGSEAYKLLIPIAKCKTHVAGTQEKTPTGYVEDCMRMVEELFPQIH